MERVVYPKQLLSSKHTVIDKQCFFVMPFAQEFDNLYDIIKMQLEMKDFRCLRVDENQEASVTLISMILQGIATSQFIIVDISTPNANVFYELGIAHVLKDMDNVFMIKNKKSTEPFDIKHLQYIPYDENRLKDLSLELISRLEAKQYKSTFKRIIVNRGFLDEKDAYSFISYLDTKISDKNIIMKFADLLSTDTLQVTNERELDVIVVLDDLIKEETRSTDTERYLPKLFQLYFHLLLPCYCIEGVDEIVSEFLLCDNFGGLRPKVLRGYQTELAILFADKGRLKDICLHWIIDYFQRSKSTNVDLNRYKLESFLLNSKSEDVNTYIANAIVAENKYIREHMADIAGEKQLYTASNHLILQLKREENTFTVSSIMEALGKLKVKEAIVPICDWIKNHKEDLIKKQDIFVIKHARNAIRSIDSSSSNVSLTEFEKEYLPILNENNMY